MFLNPFGDEFVGNVDLHPPVAVGGAGGVSQPGGEGLLFDPVRNIPETILPDLPMVSDFRH